MTQAPFNQRLKDAIASGSSATVAALIREAETISERALSDADAAKTRALDPLLDDAEIEIARKASLDAEFVQARMAEAVRMLAGKRDEFRKAEDQVERLSAYEAATARRDAAVGRLRNEFPDLANRLGQLLSDVVATDAQVQAVNANLPAGRAALAYVEALARPGYEPNGVQALTRMQIPAFDARAPNPTWGQSRLGASFDVVYRPNKIGSANDDASGDGLQTSSADQSGAPLSLRLIGPGHSRKGEAA